MSCCCLSLLSTLIFLSGCSAYAHTEIFTEHQEVYTPIVWLTDIHLDLLFDPHASGKSWCRVKLNVEEAQQRKDTTSTSVPFGPGGRRDALGEAPPSPMSPRELKREAALTLPAWWGRYGCDAPPQLVTHCFNSLVNLTASHLLHVAMSASSDLLPNTTQSRRLGSPFVVITGDSSAHYWESRAKEHRWQSLVTLTSMLQNLSDSLGDAYNELVSLQTPQQQQPFVPPFGLDFYRPSKFLRHEKKDGTKKNEEENENAGHKGVGSQVVIIVGNNDLPEDYSMEEWGSWAGRLFKLWSPHFIPPTAENTESFHRGMYYWTPIYSTPGLRAICLNTMWWSMGFPWTTKRRRPSDPGGQLAWLREQLKDAEQKNESVFILGHIPPGISYSADHAFRMERQWYKHYEGAYLKLIAKYRRRVVAQLFGHFHTDDFRIETLQRELQDGRVAERQKRQKDQTAIKHGDQIPQKESTTVTAVGGLLLAPSVGSSRGNNPGFRILELVTSIGLVRHFHRNPNQRRSEDDVVQHRIKTDAVKGVDSPVVVNSGDADTIRSDLSAPEPSVPSYGRNSGWGQLSKYLQRLSRRSLQNNHENLDHAQLSSATFLATPASTSLRRVLLDNDPKFDGIVMTVSKELMLGAGREARNASQHRVVERQEQEANSAATRFVLLEEQSPSDELYIDAATASQRTGVAVTEASTITLDQRFVLLDYHQYVSPLHSPIVTELGTYSPVIPPPFVKEYSFREVYRQPDVTASSIENALTKIHTDKHFFKQFWTHFDTGGSQPAAFFLRCYQAVSLTLKECIKELINEAKGNGPAVVDPIPVLHADLRSSTESNTMPLPVVKSSVTHPCQYDDHLDPDFNCSEFIVA